MKHGTRRSGPPSASAPMSRRCSSCATPATSSATATCCCCSPASSSSSRSGSRRSTAPGCGCTSAASGSSRLNCPKSCCASSSRRTSRRTKNCSRSRRPGSATVSYLDPRPLAADHRGVGRSRLGDHRPGGRHRLRRAFVRALHRSALGRHRSRWLPRPRPGALRGGRLHRGALLRAGARPCRRVAEPMAHEQPIREQWRLPARAQAWYGMGTGRCRGHRPGPRRPPSRCLVPEHDQQTRSPGGSGTGLDSVERRLAVVVAFVLLVGAGLRIDTDDALRTSAASWPPASRVIIGFQAFFIMAGVVRLLPFTGVTLPFVAYGGRRSYRDASSYRCCCGSRASTAR